MKIGFQMVKFLIVFLLGATYLGGELQAFAQDYQTAFETIDMKTVPSGTTTTLRVGKTMRTIEELTIAFKLRFGAAFASRFNRDEIYIVLTKEYDFTQAEAAQIYNDPNNGAQISLSAMVAGSPVDPSNSQFQSKVG